ncbi:MAG TPA: hypothetical protein VK964_18540 [Nocardioidaceae bacterium]|nr:hypothetical protein [Nocardioidaceae bacterium]
MPATSSSSTAPCSRLTGYAVTLTVKARRFTLVHSEIRVALDQILRVITWVLVPTAVLLGTTQLLIEHTALDDAIRGSVAGVVGMVPEGLVLLTSVAFAVGVIRIGARGVLVEELPAIEGLARVDVVGIDKTGTLTEGTMTVGELVPLGDASDVRTALGALARSDERPNASMRALAEALPAPEGWQVVERVPFSSDRKWSSPTYAGRGTWILGAPEALLAAETPVLTEAEHKAATGNRVLLLVRAERADASSPTSSGSPTSS